MTETGRTPTGAVAAQRRLGWLQLSLALVSGVLLLSLWFALSASPGIDVKATKSHLICKDLAFATEAYQDHSANPEHRLPSCVDDLIHPPWGGPSLYRDGAEEPRDPWGNLFQMERRRTPDGRHYLLFWTVTPDGIRISQFGVGQAAEPSW